MLKFVPVFAKCTGFLTSTCSANVGRGAWALWTGVFTTIQWCLRALGGKEITTSECSGALIKSPTQNSTPCLHTDRERGRMFWVRVVLVE